MRKINKKIAQSTLEYAILIVIVAIALLATQAYIKRGVAGRLKSSADEIGEQFSAQQSTITINTTTGSHSNEIATGATQTSTILKGAADNYSNRSETINFTNADLDYWGRNADGK